MTSDHRSDRDAHPGIQSVCGWTMAAKITKVKSSRYGWWSPSVIGKLWTIVKIIDTISLWSGKIVRWLLFPLLFGTTYEAISRYVFNAPTIWAYDLSYFLYGSIFMLGAAYTLYTKNHIRTDIFYAKWSPKTQGWIDATLYLLFFFPWPPPLNNLTE